MSRMRSIALLVFLVTGCVTRDPAEEQTAVGSGDEIAAPDAVEAAMASPEAPEGEPLLMPLQFDGGFPAFVETCDKTVTESCYDLPPSPSFRNRYETPLTRGNVTLHVELTWEAASETTAELSMLFFSRNAEGDVTRHALAEGPSPIALDVAGVLLDPAQTHVIGVGVFCRGGTVVCVRATPEQPFTIVGSATVETLEASAPPPNP